MRSLAALLLLLLLLPAAAALRAAAHECTAQSGPGTAALVELYTSQGCSSCPPAERWLSSLAHYGLERVVPIALHVDYWDYLGWRDAFAQREFARRQRKLTHLQRLALVYTPQVMLQGRDFRGWGTGDFDEALSRINARPSRASLALEILEQSSRGFRVRARAELLERRATEGAVLYLALYGNRLETEVSAGENRGRTLRHDFVALQWEGPFRFAGVRHEEERRLALPPEIALERAGVAAFLQDPRSGEVLQALGRRAC